MKKSICAVICGIVINFGLFLLKLYIGIASNVLAVYCDAVNNLGDVFTCLTALGGFWLVVRLDRQRGARAESLCSFVIGLVLLTVGSYFMYNGVERLFYPLPIAYATTHAILLLLTLPVKLLLAWIYRIINRSRRSTVLHTLFLDSILDTAMTAFVLFGFFLIPKVQLAVDGIFAIAVGLFVVLNALKTVYTEAKFLINNGANGG